MEKTLAVVGFALSAALFSAGCAHDRWEAERAALVNRERPLLFNADGNEMVYYPMRSPITYDGFCAQRLNGYTNSAISTLCYCPWSSGFGLMSTLRAGEFFDRPIDLNEGCTNAAPLFARELGTDALEMTSRFCRTDGREIIVSIRVNDTHDNWYFQPGTNPPRSWLFPKWKEAHPDCLYGRRDGKNPPFGSWTAVDFEHPEVRAYMRAFVRDFVNNYDVDGIEFDFMRHCQIFKSVGWGAQATPAQLKLMTDFMGELRGIVEAAGRRKGRPLLVLVRTPDSIDYCRAVGIDIEAWLKAGVADIWSVSDYFQLEYWDRAVALAHRYGVKLYAALAESRVPGQVKGNAEKGARMLPGRNGIECFTAEYAAAMACGCDGIELFNQSCIWPLDTRKLNAIDPRRTAGLDKVYFALVRGSGGYEPRHWLKDGMSFYRRPYVDPGKLLRIPSGRPFAADIVLGDDPAAGGQATLKLLFGARQPVVKSVSVNGLSVKLGSFKDGEHAFVLPSGSWRRGHNEFSFLPEAAEKDVLFSDMAVYMKF